MKHIKLFETFDISKKDEEVIYNEIMNFLDQNGFDFYDGQEDFESEFKKIMGDDNLGGEEKVESIMGYLDEKWGLYDDYSIVYDFVKNLLT